MAESYSVFVGNLSDRVRYHDMERFFKDYGKLSDVTLKVKSNQSNNGSMYSL